MSSLLVVGTGLIGTSIGLALHGERDQVLLTDVDADRLTHAVARGAGEPWDGRSVVDTAVIAVPPLNTAAELVRLQRLDIAATLTHVASCQSRVQRDLEASGADLSAICGGHPLAGREVGGPGGATAELFAGRPWVSCRYPETSTEAAEAVHRLAVACSAEPVAMTPGDHDRAVALSSHLPQLAATAVAARLREGNGAALNVSGPGLQDTTRIAASDSRLWTQVLSANAKHIAPLATALAADLAHVAGALGVLAERPDDPSALRTLGDFLIRGNQGRALVPVKRGVLDRDLVVVGVRVPDEPGRLADLLVRAATAGVNVEDVRLEHLAGRQTGVVELLVRSQHQQALTAALGEGGLEVLRGSARE